MKEQAKELKQWLEDCNCHDVQPVTVTIKGETWVGCRYKQTLQYTAGMDCVTRGEKKAGDTYTEQGIYCIGDLPKWLRRRNSQFARRDKHEAYPFEQYDWYLSGYIRPKAITEKFKEYHPFGAWFALRPWDIGEKIDAYRKPYDRYPMTVTPLE